MGIICLFFDIATKMAKQVGKNMKGKWDLVLHSFAMENWQHYDARVPVSSRQLYGI